MVVDVFVRRDDAVYLLAAAAAAGDGDGGVRLSRGTKHSLLLPLLR